MKKSILAVTTIALVLSLFAVMPATAQDDIAIQLSPNTLDLSSPGDRLTVHTDVKASLVDRNSLRLSGPGGTLEPCLVYTDACGCIVAKFYANTIVEVGRNQLTLEGLYAEGGAFSGSDVIRVQE